MTPNEPTIRARMGDDLMQTLKYMTAYRYAAWLYYHGPAEVESPLDDATFDNLEKWLKIDKGTAHWIKLSPPEQERAIAWATAAWNADEARRQRA